MARTSTKAKAAPEPTAELAPTAPTPAAATASAPTPAPNAPVEQRENPRINEKIDEWIKRFPDKWDYFMALPPERMARKLVLNEIDKYERQQKAKSYREQEQQGAETTPRHGYGQGNGNGMRAR